MNYEVKGTTKDEGAEGGGVSDDGIRETNGGNSILAFMDELVRDNPAPWTFDCLCSDAPCGDCGRPGCGYTAEPVIFDSNGNEVLDLRGLLESNSNRLGFAEFLVIAVNSKYAPDTVTGNAAADRISALEHQIQHLREENSKLREGVAGGEPEWCFDMSAYPRKEMVPVYVAAKSFEGGRLYVRHLHHGGFPHGAAGNAYAWAHAPKLPAAPSEATS